MREVVFLSWCDLCNREGRGRVEATETYTIGIVRGENRPALRVLEVCDGCKLIVTELLAVLAENSAPVDPNVLKGKNGKLKPAVEPSAIEPVELGRLTVGESGVCRICNRAMHKSSLITHVWSVHRREDKPPTPTICPECGETYDKPNAMGAHRARAHKTSALVEAYGDLLVIEQ